MVRYIYFNFREAISAAALYMVKGFKGIKFKESMPVSNGISPAGNHQRLIFSEILGGAIPPELPCLLLIDDKGRTVAEFFIYK